MRYLKRKEQAIIDGIRRLWEARELYMIDVPRHCKEQRLIIVPERNLRPGVIESERLVWVPWLSNPKRSGVVASWELRA